MASWVTHLMIADGVMQRLPNLHRRGFCVGNIAPDCNVENEDWTAFTPSREITHWMQGKKKQMSDSDVFYDEYILKRDTQIRSEEEYAFLIGYFTHLIVDAAFQEMIRDEKRVSEVWERIKANGTFASATLGMDQTWDSVKKLVPTHQRKAEMDTLEANYLQEHPNSGYLTEILPLKQFPDYIDYLPKGSIVRKIGVMGYIPKADIDLNSLISVSEKEFMAFASDAVSLTTKKIREKALL